MRLMRAAAPRMAERGGGRIVNVSSRGQAPLADERRLLGDEVRAAVALARVRRPLRASGVLVNAVAPGPWAPTCGRARGLADQTARANGVSRDEALKAQMAKVPLGRFAEPAEIADVVVFLGDNDVLLL